MGIRWNHGGKGQREQRRADAEARVAAWRSLSLQEQLKRLPPEGANRQRARITAKIAAAAEKAKQEKTEREAKKAAEKPAPAPAPVAAEPAKKGKKAKK